MYSNWNSPSTRSYYFKSTLLFHKHKVMGLWLTFSKVQRGPNFIQLLGFLAENPNIFGLGSWPIKYSLHGTDSWHPTFSPHRVMDLKETLFFDFKDWAYGFYFLYIINWTHSLLLFLTGWMGSKPESCYYKKISLKSKSYYFMKWVQYLNLATSWTVLKDHDITNITWWVNKWYSSLMIQIGL